MFLFPYTLLGSLQSAGAKGKPALCEKASLLRYSPFPHLLSLAARHGGSQSPERPSLGDRLDLPAIFAPIPTYVTLLDKVLPWWGPLPSLPQLVPGLPTKRPFYSAYRLPSPEGGAPTIVTSAPPPAPLPFPLPPSLLPPSDLVEGQHLSVPPVFFHHNTFDPTAVGLALILRSA